MIQVVVVYKFGGASVKDATAFPRVFDIIQARPESGLVVVLSAMGKTTNALEALSQRVSLRQDYTSELTDIIQYHQAVARILQLFDHKDFERSFSDCTRELEYHCHQLCGSDYNLIYGHVVPMGELLSTIIMHYYLLTRGLSCRWLDARELIHASLDYREGKLCWDETSHAIQQAVPPYLAAGEVVLTQGFIGRASNGHPVTLGREGSDYSAAIFGAILGAREVVMWKDVPGILNADPREFEGAVPYTSMPYAEAMELTFYGAKVIHPKTIKPLMQRNIPLVVKSFDDILAPGTRIHGDGEPEPAMPSIIRKRDQILVSLFPRDLSFIDEHGMSQLFGQLAREEVSIDLVQNSALSLSFCAQNREGLSDRLQALFGQAYSMKYNEPVSLITIRHYTPDFIKRYTGDLPVLIEQQTRQTYQAVIDDR